MRSIQECYLTLLNLLRLMRILLVLLFLSSIVANDFVLDIVSCQDSPIENQSEKENQDGSEDEFKIDYLSHNYFKTISKAIKSQQSHSFVSLFTLNSCKEIHNPPPERF